MGGGEEEEEGSCSEATAAQSVAAEAFEDGGAIRDRVRGGRGLSLAQRTCWCRDAPWPLRTRSWIALFIGDGGLGGGGLVGGAPKGSCPKAKCGQRADQPSDFAFCSNLSSEVTSTSCA